MKMYTQINAQSYALLLIFLFLKINFDVVAAGFWFLLILAVLFVLVIPSCLVRYLVVYAKALVSGACVRVELPGNICLFTEPLES